VPSTSNNLLKFSSVPPDELIKLLQCTFIGTNGLQYQLQDTASKISELVQPTFVYVQRREQILGSITFCQRDLLSEIPNLTTYYLRYFAFQAFLHGKAKKRRGTSQTQAAIDELFQTSNLNLAAPEMNPSIFWAYIDPLNLRSFNMHRKHAFEEIGEFETIAFSRVSPRLKKKEIRPIREQEKEIVLELIKKHYEDYAFFTPTHIFDHDRFYVLVENGEIVAGIQANPVVWKFKSLPGTMGKLMMNLLPKTPFIKRIFNPKQHRFLATEAFFWCPGHEAHLQDFLSGVLTLTKHNSLFLWEDTKVKHIKNLPIKWGLLAKMTKDNPPIKIVAKFNRLTSAQKTKFKNQPTYLSGFDLT
jgi:hypothetical protein